MAISSVRVGTKMQMQVIPDSPFVSPTSTRNRRSRRAKRKVDQGARMGIESDGWNGGLRKVLRYFLLLYQQPAQRLFIH